jgi:Rod binding domain-containing protein
METNFNHIGNNINNAKLQNLQNSVDSLKTVKDKKVAQKTAQDLEKMFFAKMIKSMFGNDDDKGFFGAESSHATSMFRDLWIGAMAESGGAKALGLAKYFQKSIENKTDTQTSTKPDLKIHDMKI